MQRKGIGPLLVVLLAFVTGLAFAQKPTYSNTQPAQDPQTEVSAPAMPEASQAAPKFITVQMGTHLPLVLQNSIHTRSAKRGDQLYFETIYPITVENRVVIPAGSFVRGSLTEVKRPGRVKGRGEIHVRFDVLTLPNGYTVPLSATVKSAMGRGEEHSKEGTVVGEGSKGQDVGTVATTTATGTIIGAAAGGGQGAGIGAGAGAAAGLAAILLTRGKEVELPRGSTLDVVLNRPLMLEASMVQFDSAGRASSLAGPTPAGRSDRGNRRRPWPY